MNALLKNKALNGWALFALVSSVICVVMLVKTLSVDLSTVEGVRQMIRDSVRWSVPFVYVVAATSALRVLFPGALTTWLLRNRKYVGLMFAVAMAWQGLFIYMMSGLHRDYYFEEVFYLRDELEGSSGYLFLTAMVITSFRFGRKYLTQDQWRLLHISGLYFLWAYAFSVYFWNIYYYENPVPIDYLYYWLGFAAFALRILAWGKKRQLSVQGAAPESSTPVVLKGTGVALVIASLAAAASGLQWLTPVSEFLMEPAWSESLYYWLPYWPFEPFLPLMVMGLGVALFTHRRPVVAAPAAVAS